MLLLQIDPTQSGAIERVLEITPAGLGGYGLALAVLCVMCWIFHKNWQLSEQENKLQAQKLLDFGLNMSTLLTRVQQRLDDSKGSPEVKREILRIVDETNRIVKTVADKI